MTAKQWHKVERALENAYRAANKGVLHSPENEAAIAPLEFALDQASSALLAIRDAGVLTDGR